jgi:hypothetical protein
MQPAAGLRIDAIANAQQRFDVIAYGLGRNDVEVLGTEQVKDAIQLSDEPNGGAIPPLPPSERMFVSYQFQAKFQ